MANKETNALFDALSTPPVRPVSVGKFQTQKKKVRFIDDKIINKEANARFDALNTPPVKPKPQTQKKKVHFASPVVTQVMIIPPRSASNTTTKAASQVRPHYSWILMALSHPATKLTASILIIAGLGLLSATTFGAAPFVLGLTIGLVSFTSGAGLFSASHMMPASLETDPALSRGITNTP